MPLIILTYGSKCQGRKGTQNRHFSIDTTMEHKQAKRLEELEKRQQDLNEKMHQITKMMTSLMKEIRVVESPNFQ